MLVYRKQVKTDRHKAHIITYFHNNYCSERTNIESRWKAVINVFSLTKYFLTAKTACIESWVKSVRFTMPRWWYIYVGDLTGFRVRFLTKKGDSVFIFASGTVFQGRRNKLKNYKTLTISAIWSPALAFRFQKIPT